MVCFLCIPSLESSGYQDVCPSRCKCLDKGSVLTCRQSSLTYVPTLLSTTMVVVLDDNHIRVLRNSSFDSAIRIEIISLEKNSMVRLEIGAFELLSEMRILRLGDNRLSYLPRNIFWNNRNLEVLDLHGNLFTQMPDNIMYPLHNLKLLNVSYNQLTSPNLGRGFQFTVQLSSLDMTGNNFFSLEPHIFVNILRWDAQVTRFLNLSYCNIRHVYPNALSQLYQLESLSLEGNSGITRTDLHTALRDLQAAKLRTLNLSRMNLTNVYEFFHRLQHRKLQHLDLSFNNIEEIQQRTFYYLMDLRSLDMSQNLLDGVGDLSGLTKLESLNLAYNRIKHIEYTSFEGLQALRVLDISHNRLTSVNEGPFDNLWDLAHLDVSCNKIESFFISSGLENLETLLIRSNHIMNLDFIKNLLRLKKVDVSYNKVERVVGQLFARGHNFVMVNLSRNEIAEIDGDVFQGSSHETVDLSYNHLTTLPYFAWRRLQKLYIQGNVIANISARAFSGLATLTDLWVNNNCLREFPRGCFSDTPNLRRLALSSNPLGTFLQRPSTSSIFSSLGRLESLSLANVSVEILPSFMFTNQTQLKTLDLSMNKLSALPPATLAQMTRLVFLNISHNELTEPDPVTFHDLPRLRILDASGNPFLCTCELMRFRNWLDVTAVSLPGVRNRSSGQYQCTGPPEWKRVPLLDFHLESNTCSHHENAVIFASIGCTVLAVILTILFGVYRYKWWVKRKLHRTQYSVIDDASTVQVNPRHSREWV